MTTTPDPLEPAIEAGVAASVIAYDSALNDALGNPPGSVMGEAGRADFARNGTWRAAIAAAVRAATPIIAAGQDQALRDLTDMLDEARTQRDEAQALLGKEADRSEKAFATWATTVTDLRSRLATAEKERDEILAKIDVHQRITIAAIADLQARLATAEQDALLRAADDIQKRADKMLSLPAIAAWLQGRAAAVHGKGSGDEAAGGGK